MHFYWVTVYLPTWVRFGDWAQIFHQTPGNWKMGFISRKLPKISTFFLALKTGKGFDTRTAYPIQTKYEYPQGWYWQFLSQGRRYRAYAFAQSELKLLSNRYPNHAIHAQSDECSITPQLLTFYTIQFSIAVFVCRTSSNLFTLCWILYVASL